MKTWKDIERDRELRRLWIEEIVIPGKIGQKCTEAKNFIVSKLKKEEK